MMNRMNRIIVIGCPGGGKSTFSIRLQEITGLPLYHLDMLYWNSDKTTVGKDVLIDRLNKILPLKQWIIDGNYGSTIEMRLKECDTVFFLDYPVDVCLEGVRSRKGKPRPDMPWISDEDDDEFISFIKNFNKDSRPKIIELLKKYYDKNIFVFSNRNEAEAFFENLPKLN